MKWRTKITYVDLETGEQLTKEHVKKGHYIVVRKMIGQTKFTNDYGEKQIKHLCRRDNQVRIEYGNDRTSQSRGHTVYSGENGR